MIIIDSIYKSVQINLSGNVTSNQFNFVTAYADNLASTGFTSGGQAGLTNNTSNVTILTSPPSGAQRQLKFFSIYNADTASNIVTLYVVSGSVQTIIGTFNLLPNQTLVYDQDSGFQTLSSQNLYVQSVTAIGNLFTGGTTLNPIIEISSSPIFITLTANTLSATTYQGLPNFSTTTTGATSISFGYENSKGEDSFATTAITDSNVTANSQIIFNIQLSSDHNEIEDALIDGIILSASNLIPTSGFTINAFAVNNTWGTYNILYKIIN